VFPIVLIIFSTYNPAIRKHYIGLMTFDHINMINRLWLSFTLTPVTQIFLRTGDT